MKFRIFTCSLPQHESARAAALRQQGASSPGRVLRGLINFKPPFYPKKPHVFPSKPFLPSCPVILQPRQQLGFGQVVPPRSSPHAGRGQGEVVALPPSCPVGRSPLHQGPPIAGAWTMGPMGQAGAVPPLVPSPGM